MLLPLQNNLDELLAVEGVGAGVLEVRGQASGEVEVGAATWFVVRAPIVGRGGARIQVWPRASGSHGVDGEALGAVTVTGRGIGTAFAPWRPARTPRRPRNRAEAEREARLRAEEAFERRLEWVEQEWRDEAEQRAFEAELDRIALRLRESRERRARAELRLSDSV